MPVTDTTKMEEELLALLEEISTELSMMTEEGDMLSDKKSPRQIGRA
jgi:hypothetical protein